MKEVRADVFLQGNREEEGFCQPSTPLGRDLKWQGTTFTCSSVIMYSKIWDLNEVSMRRLRGVATGSGNGWGTEVKISGPTNKSK
jgi:hypothetical protein